MCISIDTQKKPHNAQCSSILVIFLANVIQVQKFYCKQDVNNIMYNKQLQSSC